MFTTSVGARQLLVGSQPTDARTVESPAPEPVALFVSADDGGVERVMTIARVVFDWNCPQFIIPRFDASDLSDFVGLEIFKLETRIAELKAESASLRAQ